MKLPETHLTSRGFTVLGAGPDLLSELLHILDFEAKKRGVPVDDYYAPGLSRSQVEDPLGQIGISPPEELLVWWGWHNGIRSPKYMTRLDQFSLDVAVSKYQHSDRGSESIFEWHPSWIHVAGSGNDGMAVCCDPTPSGVLVRSVSPSGSGTQPEETETQVVSLCTPITWELLGIAKGWMRWNASDGHWDTDESRVPLEWALTELI
ncbi:hypothetical protein BH09ACT1_BH09ACT1_12080 [soil metagenome]